MSSGGAQTARPRIAALERGPGPARYSLPTLTGFRGHDSTRQMHPAYSFGMRLGSSIFKKDIGPGPAHFVDPSLTYRGKDGTPHYSLSARHKELAAFKTPGPCAYRAEKVSFLNEKRTPAYSMGGRTKYRKRDATPSPNTYTLPGLLGPHIPNRTSSACYSLAGRPKVGGIDTDYAKTPGPARYGVTSAELYTRRAPCYSMRKRSFMPGDATKKPGPGAHSPEKFNPKSSPAYSLGIRHSEFLCPLIIDISE